MTTDHRRPQEALAAIRSLRGRHRRLQLLEGLLRVVIMLSLLIGVTFLLDWTLRLPVGIRVLHLFGSVALLALGTRFFLGALRRPLGDARLAAHMEDAVSGFDEALITAVQLTEPGNPRRDLYSPELLARTIAEAEAHVRSVHVGELLSRRRVTQQFLVAVALVAVLGATALERPDLARTYVARDLLLRGVQWPREHFFDIVEPSTRELLLAMGDSFSVVAERTQGGETRVAVLARYDGGERETFQLERKGASIYRKVFRNVGRDFLFQVRGGDFTSEEYVVRVRNRPRIEKILLSFDYPDYTGLADVATPTADLGGHIKVPVGTQVRYTALPSIPVARAIFTQEWREGREERSHSEEMTVTEDGLSGEFVAAREGYYYFRLTSEDDFENTNPIRYRISLIHDHPPAIHIDKPGKNIEVSARARFPIRFEARDDYGITALALVVRSVPEDETEPVEHRIPYPVGDAGGMSKELAGEHLFDLEQWNPRETGITIQEGSRLEYYAESLDSLDQVGVSRTFSLTIVREEDLTRIFQDVLSRVREQLEEALGWQREIGRSLREVLNSSRLSGDSIGEASVSEVRATRRLQERVNTRLEDDYELLAEIVRRVVENRLTGVVKDLAWMEGIRDQLQRLALELGPEALDGLDRLGRDAVSGHASSAQIEAGLERTAEVEKALAAIVQELGEWGDIRTVIRKLEELIQLEGDLERRVGDQLRDGDRRDGGRDDRRR